MKVFSENEWDPLKSVIVGNAFDQMSFNVDLSFKLFFKDFYDWGWLNNTKKHIKINKQYITELNEDLDLFVDVLKKEGITVYRPTELKCVTSIQTPFWKTEMLPALNVRDQSLILGNTIIETPPMQRQRYFENELLKQIYNEGYLDGCNWLQMPKPSLSDSSIKARNEMMIDGAQFVRFGKDIIVNISSDSHEQALNWFRIQFPDYNFHVINSLVENHLDSYVVPLCEGVLLLRDKEFLKQMPDFLKDWKIIYPPKITEDAFPKYNEHDTMLTTPFIDMNVLSLDGNKIITNSMFPELSEMLYKEGFNPIPVQHRHRRIFAGGFHCFTLDLERKCGLNL